MATRASSTTWTIFARFYPIFPASFFLTACRLLVRGEKIGFIFLLISVLAGFWWWCFCRHVVLVSFDEYGLRLDGWRAHASVPWDLVESMKLMQWIKGCPYAITFRQPTTFGKRVFMILPQGWSGRRDELLSRMRLHCRFEE